jgi:hypothetical protein
LPIADPLVLQRVRQRSFEFECSSHIASLTLRRRGCDDRLANGADADDAKTDHEGRFAVFVAAGDPQQTAENGAPNKSNDGAERCAFDSS